MLFRSLKDDRLQSWGKAPLLNHSQQGIFPLRPRKDLRMQDPKAQIREVNVAFKEPVHKIVDRIKNESFFRWPNKMGVTRFEGTKTCIVPITGIRGTPPSNVGY